MNVAVTERLRDLSHTDFDSQHPTKPQHHLLLLYSPPVEKEKASVYAYPEEAKVGRTTLLGAIEDSQLGQHRP